MDPNVAVILKGAGCHQKHLIIESKARNVIRRVLKTLFREQLLLLRQVARDASISVLVVPNPQVLYTEGLSSDPHNWVRALVDEKLAIIIVGALPPTFKELARASALLALPDFCKEMLRVPPVKLLERIMGDNIRVKILFTVDSFPFPTVHF